MSVVAGDAGIGKTAVWEAAVEEAKARGFLVLSSRPSEAEARLSFSGLADLLGAVVSEALPELPVPQRRALESALALSDHEERIEERLVAFGFLTAVRVLARDSPLLLAIDDVQWLDEPSLALLRYALPRFEDAPVAGVLTARGAVPGWLGRMEGVVELDLRPLSVGALHELLRTRLDSTFPRPILLRIWETSGGNPFFALELARALQRRGGRIEPGEKLPVPETLEGLVLERLEMLTPEADEACRVVAASSDPTIELVEHVAGGADGVEEALRARVLELDRSRLRFTHPLLGSAIAGRTVGARRRSLHERLAAVASDPEQQARHLALAAPAPSTEVAAALDRAARRARQRGSAGAAAELAEQALLLTPAGDDEGRRRRLLEAADLHFEAGDVERSLRVLDGAREEAPAGPARGAVLLRLGRLRAETSGAAEAVALWREALAEADGDDPLKARVLLDLGQFLRFTEGTESALAQLDEAVSVAARIGDDDLECRTRAAHALVHFNSGRGIHHDGMERALTLESALAERSPAMPATPFLVHQLVWCGEYASAREAHDRWLAWARSGSTRIRVTPRGISHCSTGATAAGTMPPRPPPARSR